MKAARRWRGCSAKAASPTPTARLYADDVVVHEAVRVDGEPLDPPQGLLLALNKPTGVTCSSKDAGRVVYDLLPPRFRLRNPALSTDRRLDRALRPAAAH